MSWQIFVSSVASALKMSTLSKSCQIRLTAKKDIDIIFHCNLFSLALRAITSNVLVGHWKKFKCFNLWRVSCFQISLRDEMMIMMSPVFRHRLLRHQAILLMIEHRRRRRRRRARRRHNPYFSETSAKTRLGLVRDPLQWPNNSRGVFRKATANESLYLRYSVECFATCRNTRKHKIAIL